MIVVAPASRHPATMDRPMPPARARGRCRPSHPGGVEGGADARLHPAPDDAGDLERHVGGDLTAPVSWMTTCSAKPATPSPRYTVSPPRLSRVPPSGWVEVISACPLTHRLCSPRRHQ